MSINAHAGFKREPETFDSQCMCQVRLTERLMADWSWHQLLVRVVGLGLGSVVGSESDAGFHVGSPRKSYGSDGRQVSMPLSQMPESCFHHIYFGKGCNYGGRNCVLHRISNKYIVVYQIYNALRTPKMQ